MSVIQYGYKDIQNIANYLLQGKESEDYTKMVLDNLNILCKANAKAYSARYRESYEPTFITPNGFKKNLSMNQIEKLAAISTFRMIPYQCEEYLTDCPVTMRAYHDLSKLILDRVIRTFENVL